jgi:hypothetical protein
MNKRDKEFAKQAWTENDWDGHVDIPKLINLIRADEREACAKVCEEVAVDSYTKIGMAHEPYMKATAEDCARHIRARGQA